LGGWESIDLGLPYAVSEDLFADWLRQGLFLLSSK